MQRQLVRLGQLPLGKCFPLPVTLWQLGDGYWLMLEGEYYQALQCALRERFRQSPIVITTVVNGWRPAYLPTRETYGRGIYQEQVAVLAPGCLEAVIEAVALQLAAWQKRTCTQRTMMVEKKTHDEKEPPTCRRRPGISDPVSRRRVDRL